MPEKVMDRLRPRFIVHTPDQGRAALDAMRASPFSATPILLSAPNYAHLAGVAVFQAMMETLCLDFPRQPFASAVDCGDAPGYAMAALRCGVTGIVVHLDAAALNKIEDMARQSGCTVYTPDIYEGDVLDMDSCHDSASDCQQSCLAYLAHLERLRNAHEHG